MSTRDTGERDRVVRLQVDQQRLQHRRQQQRGDGPTAKPIAVRSMPCLTISPRTVVECAPSASADADLARRTLTAYDTTP